MARNESEASNTHKLNPLEKIWNKKELKLNYVWTPTNSTQFQSAGATLPAAGYAGAEPHGYATAVSQTKVKFN